MAALLVVLLLAPSEVIFPPQSLPLAFSHRVHLAKNLACDFCHEKAPSSQKAADRLIPGEDVCETCHKIDRAKPDAACAKCHPGWTPGAEVARVVVPPPNLRFSHAAHTQKGVACARCHGDLKDVDLATRRQLPEMGLCLSCHDSRRGALHASSRCATCHLTRADGTVETAYAAGSLKPSGKLRGAAHTMDFRTRHAAVARDEERLCLSCHRQDYCLSCHNGVVKPFDFHGNDYVSRHAVDARRNDPDCSACHRGQSFCLGCHERMGVVDLRTGVGGPFAPAGNRRFHPEGWADPRAAGQSNHHAWQAQRNLRQCTSCHRQETCLECHASSGAGLGGKMSVSPHPLDWRGSERCQALADRNPRVCLKCHAPDDPNMACR